MISPEATTSRKDSHRFRIFRRFFDLASASAGGGPVSFLAFNNALHALQKKSSTTTVSDDDNLSLNLDQEHLTKIHDIALSIFKSLDSGNNGVLTLKEVDAYSQRTANDIDESLPSSSSSSSSLSRDHGTRSPLGSFLMHHLTQSVDFDPASTSAQLMSLSPENNLITTNDSDSSDGELGVPYNPDEGDGVVAPPASGVLDVLVAEVGGLEGSNNNNNNNSSINNSPGGWSSSEFQQALSTLEESQKPEMREALIVIEKSLNYFLEQQIYFQSVAEQNNLLREELRQVAESQQRGPVIIPDPTPSSEGMQKMQQRLDDFAAALQSQLEENKILRQAVRGIQKGRGTYAPQQSPQHQPPSPPSPHQYVQEQYEPEQYESEQYEQEQHQPRRTSPLRVGEVSSNSKKMTATSPSISFGKVSETHRSKRRLQTKKPKRLHEPITRTDTRLDPSLVSVHHTRDFVRERSPDKTSAQIRKDSRAKVDDHMPLQILELTKPIDINYVEDRSYFEAELDNTEARRQQHAARVQLLDDGRGGGRRHGHY